MYPVKSYPAAILYSAAMKLAPKDFDLLWTNQRGDHSTLNPWDRCYHVDAGAQAGGY
jgi:hypothetical protein